MTSVAPEVAEPDAIGVLEASYRADADEFKQVIGRSLASAQLFRLATEPTDIVEIDRLGRNYLETDAEMALTPTVRVAVHEAMCAGRNIGRMLVQFSTERDRLAGIPDLATVTGNATTFDKDALGKWFRKHDNLMLTSTAVGVQIADRCREDRVKMPAAYACGFVLRAIDEQAANRLGTLE